MGPNKGWLERRRLPQKQKKTRPRPARGSNAHRLAPISLSTASIAMLVLPAPVGAHTSRFSLLRGRRFLRFWRLLSGVCMSRLRSSAFQWFLVLWVLFWFAFSVCPPNPQAPNA
jgi:hypothetical protein